MNPQWNQFLSSRGAVMADDATVAHFGNAAAELQAAAQGSIMADLSHYGLLQVDGADAVTFLQGQLTNDVKQLDGSHSQYAGYCTAKGRLLAIFLAYARQDSIFLQLNGALKEPIMKRLKMYVLRSKVAIADVSDSIMRIGVAGANAEATLKQVFGGIPQQPHQLLSLENVSIIRLPGATPSFELLVAREHAEAVWEQLQQSCTPVGTASWNWLGIRAGIPDITPATQEAFVPQMVNLDLLGGINFKKGCYTGQEIVARTHYLGKVKRRTHLAHVDAAEIPASGNPVYGADSAEAVGIVVSAAPAPTGGYDLLAEIRLESVEAGPVRLSGTDGPVLELMELPYPL